MRPTQTAISIPEPFCLEREDLPSEFLWTSSSIRPMQQEHVGSESVTD